MGCEGFCNKPGVPVDADFRLAAGCPGIAPLLLTSSILAGPDIFILTVRFQFLAAAQAISIL
jgi:hypothetical protein